MTHDSGSYPHRFSQLFPHEIMAADVVVPGSMANSCFFLAKGSFHYTFEKSYEVRNRQFLSQFDDQFLSSRVMAPSLILLVYMGA